MENYLQELVSELATFRSVLKTQDITDATSSFTPLEKDIRKALSNSLDALEAACENGLDLLADEKAYTSGSTSTATGSAQPNRVLSPDNESLLSELDDLDALMDSEIVLGEPTPTTITSTTAHAKQQ